MLYEYNRERFKKSLKRKLIIGLIILLALIGLTIASNIYLEIIQLDEIGNLSSIYIKNLIYKLISAVAGFVIVFAAISITNIFIKNNLREFFREKNLPQRRLPNLPIAAVFSLIAALLLKDVFYQKALNFFNSTSFNTQDPIFNNDVGYYVFQRPFLMALYDFVSTLWLFIIIYTAVYYLFVLFTTFNNLTFKDLKVKSILRHNLINIAIFFIIKAFSYKFLREGILFSNVVGSRGASYVDVNVWLKYYAVAPILLTIIVIVSFIFIVRGKLKISAIAIAVFPAVWIIVSITAGIVQSFIVSPNEYNMEKEYLQYNIQKTREAYNFGKISNYDFSTMKQLTPEIINRNPGTVDNIRIVDYESTLVSDVQLQSIKNFYTFIEGDIINFTINGKKTPVFITAREIDTNRLPDKTYVNTTYKYTHGYGIVINPINRITPQGQVDFILSGLQMRSVDENLVIKQPRIYYGELTRRYVIVNASNNLNEVDYDGNAETRYEGLGGIKLNFLNRVLFALKYGDLKLITSGYANNATLLPNREVVSRAQRAVPFLLVDKDPYIIPTNDGRLKWVLDAYTTTDSYPYAQNYGNINYIRNSVKIVIDAYDGKVKYYIIDKDDPIIKTYSKIYPGIFSEEPLPEDIASHMRYPELLFKIQTEMLKKYHLRPEDVSEFYTKQDLWDIAKYPADKNLGDVRDIDPYYNMIKLPGGIGDEEELILMRPFTPSGELKHNMVSWLAVRNSYENYGEMILFNFPENTNIFGPYQVEVKINQIDQVSKDMTLWGQSGSDVYKGSLLVVPIENSILYVEPIYIRSAGTSSIPEVREVVVGYQSGDEFKYGIGRTLNEALNNLFAGAIPPPDRPAEDDRNEGEEDVEEKIIDDIISKYDKMRQQLEELGELINQLRR